MELETSIQIDKIVQTYIKIRSKREELTQKYKTEYDSLSDKMAYIKHIILARMCAQNVESMSTAEGVVYRTVDRKYWTSDWEAFHNLVVTHNLPQLLEKRVHQTNAREFFEANPDLIPSGLKVDSEYSVTIRRK
jgi:hypothetical protein